MTTLTARAVLFDMDGTLVDSSAVVGSVWARFARMHGLELDSVLATSEGVRMEDTVRRHAPVDADVASIVSELSAFEIASTEPVLAIIGAEGFVRSLPVSAVALVTSATLDLAELRMLAIGVALPRVVVTASDVSRGKPAPDCYLLAADLLGVAPADAVVFEDAPAGIEAARAAGIRVVVVGRYDGEAARGLPRIADYSGVSTVTTATGELAIRL